AAELDSAHHQSQSWELLFLGRHPDAGQVGAGHGEAGDCLRFHPPCALTATTDSSRTATATTIFFISVSFLVTTEGGGLLGEVRDLPALVGRALPLLEPHLPTGSGDGHRTRTFPDPQERRAERRAGSVSDRSLRSLTLPARRLLPPSSWQPAVRAHWPGARP